MNLQQFTAESIAQIVVSKYINQPGKNSWKDGGLLGECVSEVNQYCWRVLGVPAAAWGNAKDWATSPEVAKYFDHVTSVQAGDIGVSGATISNPDGHIWIYLAPNIILEQNGRISRRVSTSGSYITPIAILRKKGTNVAKTIWESLDETNKNLDNLYKITDNIAKNVDKIYELLNQTNQRLDKLEEK